MCYNRFMNKFSEFLIDKFKHVISKPIRLISIIIVGFIFFKSASTFFSETEQVVVGNKDSELIESIVENTLGSANDNEPFNFNKETYDALYQVNSDMIGYIHFDNGIVSEPIVQCEDNEYYVRHSFSSTDSSQGAIFMDAHTSFFDTNPILYGHNVLYDANAKFSPLANLRKQSYYEENSTFTIYTKDIYDEVISVKYAITDVFEFDTSEEKEDFSYVKFNFDDQMEFERWYYNVQINSLITSIHGQPEYGDKLLTLQTCKNLNDTTRIIILAKQI